jgi:hypothetical protein
MWDTGNSSLIDAVTLQKDEPLRLANFIRTNPVERSRNGYWNKWALTTIAAISRATRRLRNIYEPTESSPDGSFIYRRARRVLRRTTKHENKKPFLDEPAIVLGVPVSRNPTEAAAFDKANGNTLWMDSNKKEVDGIQEHGTFVFLPPGAKPPEGYQKAPL